MAHRISGLHRPHRREAERPRPKRIARNAGFAAVLVAAAGAAAYVSDHRSWLPEAFRQAGSDAAPPSPGLQPAAATEDPRRKQEADRRAQDERIKAEDERRADELRRQNDDELRRIAEERRRAQEKPGEEEERRAKALAEYQRKQIEQSEAERRPNDPAKTPGPERKRADDGAAPESGPNQPPNSDRSATEPPRTMPEPRGNYEPYESPDSRRAGIPGANPGAPPTLRRPNSPGPPQGYYPPEAPGSRGRGTDWRPPGYSDDY